MPQTALPHTARFDRYVVVDWSASGIPKTGADSIWIADLTATADEPVWTNPPTRHLAERALDATMAGARAAGERVLVAVDVALGYPSGTAAHFGLGDAAPWRAMWTWLEQELHDDDRNRNDRFAVAARLNARTATEGPFWGCPPSGQAGSLRSTKPPTFELPEFRATDRRLHDLGRRPFSVWQLLGVGSVGSQTLTALPMLRRLVERHRADVWPFTTGLAAPRVEPGSIVVAEVWPSGFELDIPVHWVKDAGQVAGVARRLREADHDGTLETWWRPDLDGAEETSEAIVHEEGWILGVT